VDLDWAWDDDASAGGWIAGRLGRWGTPAGIVPAGYPAGAAVRNDAVDERGGSYGTLLAGGADRPDRLDDLLAALAPVSGDQRYHFALWTGFGDLYDRGTDPLASRSIGVTIAVGPDDPPLGAAERRARAAEYQQSVMIERPVAPMLELPGRDYHLWHGPLGAARAMERADHSPNLMWPEDRSWFVVSEIDWLVTVVAGSRSLIGRLLADPMWAATEVPDAGPVPASWYVQD